jgi:tyrosinase
MKRSTLESATPHEPDHVYLNLENIKSPTDAAIIYVYINLPAGANPDDHPECFAGAVSLFGARKATAADGPHGGNGISESLDITAIVDRLHINDALGPELSVKFVAGTPNATDKITIDRVSIYRQGH